VLVDGVPVHETSFASDPLNPVRNSSLPALFALNGQALTCVHDAVEAEAQLAIHDAVVVDAATETDLHDLVEKEALTRTGDRRHARYALNLP
jgi:uncharacterized protein YgbK (DUF1537 family)